MVKELKVYYDGLDEEGKALLKTLTDQVNCEELSEEIQYHISSILRYILFKIRDKDAQYYPFKNHPELVSEIIKAIDVNEVVRDFAEMWENQLPEVKKIFPHIDYECEMSILFCSNYVLGLLTKTLKNNATR